MKELFKKPLLWGWIAWGVIIILLLLAWIFGWFGFKGMLGTTILSFENNETMNVKETVNQVADLNDKVFVDYIGKFEDGELFDTSFEQLAKENDLYQEGRPYEPLSFVIGEGGMIAGFENGVLDMKVGETKSIIIDPIDAYGEATYKIPLALSSPDNVEFVNYKIWESIDLWGGFEAIVVEKDEETITLEMDNPHPLAGKTLIFDITLVNLEKNQ